MKLLTKALLKSLPALYSTDGVPLEEKTAVLKFFDPSGSYTLFVFEGEEDSGDVRFFGYVTGLGSDEMGYASLQELESVRGRFGLGIERDQHFPPTPMSKILKEA